MKLICKNTGREVVVGHVQDIGISQPRIVRIEKLDLYEAGQYSNFTLEDQPCAVITAHDAGGEIVLKDCATSGAFFGWEIVQ